VSDYDDYDDDDDEDEDGIDIVDRGNAICLGLAVPIALYCCCHIPYLVVH